jgi:hypothetical protein
MSEPISLDFLFGLENDEQAVLSVCVAREINGSWRLAHGSLLMVPSECAKQSWPQWGVTNGDPHPRNYDPPLPASLTCMGEDWLLGRFLLNLKQAEAWFEELWAAASVGGIATLPRLDKLPEITVQVGLPAAPVRVVPQVDSAASTLIAGLRRPVQGLIFPAIEPPDIAVPDRVEAAGHLSFTPSMDLTGIHLTQDWAKPELATLSGLLVGRAERRAWLRDSRGQGGFKRYIAEIGWDPARIDPYDLTVTHSEFMNGDLVLSARFPLDAFGLDLDAECENTSVELPTLGRSVTHELRLETLDGELLDRSGPYPLVESISVAIKLNGEQDSEPVVVGGRTEPPPQLDERLVRLAEVDLELAAGLSQVAKGRILADRRATIDELRKRLRRARGELLIMDRFFGQDESDWSLLEDLKVRIRVLTGRLPIDEDNQPLPVSIDENVEVRHRRKAPIHDRVYLWDGGGLTMGGSPTTFGNAPLRLAPLASYELPRWRAEFEALWASPLFTTVPRCPN